ncbi:MAG TPA: DUF2812 domain-containing protein [Candidatus Blautia faecigallinarum]|uniref:DUF2812 domain-containing protein n=1 Tax=Candidatus Blautia faecigallinarum TaxID=2838488 RepID=A0A9D2DUD0_9FIRM|nr:DUF2812 domain-containing protein [Candidatus Blautia faecigallinarum]
MKDKKTEIRFFTIVQWKQEEDYLRRNHQNGWKFTGVTFFGYHFERCEPEDVIYQLDYNPDGIAHKEEYIRLFQDCGWEYLQDFVGYSYFRKPASQMRGEEEIFCDDESRLEMMKRIFHGRMTPLLFIFALIILPNIFRQIISGTFGMHGETIIFLILFVLYLVIFIIFGYQFYQYKHSLKE